MTAPAYEFAPLLVGPGVLTIGEIGDVQSIAKQTKKAEVTWDVEEGDTEPTLDGGSIDGDTTYAAKLSVTVKQDDLREGGFIRWTWENKGAIVPFSYEPSTAAESQITGEVKVAPLNVGGDVKTKPDAEFEWAIIGEPELGASL